MAVRLPRTERAPALLHIEQTWLPVVADRLPLPTPIPVRVGQPSSLFEHIWTIARWVAGEPADRGPVTRIDAADVLAEFLRALHEPAPIDAPTNPGRGIPFAEFEEDTDECFAVIADHPSADGARQVWDEALAAPGWTGGPLWLEARRRGSSHT